MSWRISCVRPFLLSAILDILISASCCSSFGNTSFCNSSLVNSDNFLPRKLTSLITYCGLFTSSSTRLLSGSKRTSWPSGVKTRTPPIGDTAVTCTVTLFPCVSKTVMVSPSVTSGTTVLSSSVRVLKSTSIWNSGFPSGLSAVREGTSSSRSFANTASCAFNCSRCVS